MQVVVIVFISILVISFITGLFITFFEKKVVLSGEPVVTEDNKNDSTSVVSAVHDAPTPGVVNPVVVPTSPAVVENATVVPTSPAVVGNASVVVSPVNVEKTVSNFGSNDEILGETMVLDVPEIIRVLNDDEDIETI